MRNLHSALIKQIFFSIIILIAILFSSCTVTDKVSILLIKNKCDQEIKNIKIGDNIITIYLAKGATFEYYIFSNLEGTYTADGAISAGYATNTDVNRYSITPRTGTYHLIAGNYYYESDIFKQGNNNDIYMTLRCEKYNYNWENDSYENYPNTGFYTE